LFFDNSALFKVEFSNFRLAYLALSRVSLGYSWDRYLLLTLISLTGSHNFSQILCGAFPHDKLCFIAYPVSMSEGL